MHSLVKNSTNSLFCNKGMPSARPQMQQNECWALAPEGGWLGPYGLFHQSCEVMPYYKTDNQVDLSAAKTGFLGHYFPIR
jgi:hypothetical protein